MTSPMPPAANRRLSRSRSGQRRSSASLSCNLPDDTVLRVRLFQMRAIAGGDSYEEINYLDQSLSEPLPFIVEYPDGQN